MSPRYRCPSCHKSSGFWEEVDVPGWISLDDTLSDDGRSHDVDWSEMSRSGLIGCSECDWRGTKGGAEKLGIDGEPLEPVHPDQLGLV